MFRKKTKKRLNAKSTDIRAVKKNTMKTDSKIEKIFCSINIYDDTVCFNSITFRIF